MCGIISREHRIISREPRGAGPPDLCFQRDAEEREAAGKAVTQEQLSGERTAPALTATRPEVADKSAGALRAHPAVLLWRLKRPSCCQELKKDRAPTAQAAKQVGRTTEWP